MIRTMAIVGPGLIGMSVGLAAARRGVTVHLRDADVAAVRAAAALGAGVRQQPEGPVDLAVPPSHVGTILAREHRRGPGRGYTGVARVEEGPMAGALPHAPRPAPSMGARPAAGRARSGHLVAPAGWFTSRAQVLTPVPEPSQATLNRELTAMCDATPAPMSDETHDNAVIRTSRALARFLTHGSRPGLGRISLKWWRLPTHWSPAPGEIQDSTWVWTRTC